jgi:gliding motility-associated-like protein
MTKQLLLFTCLILFSVIASAQLCTGSLGDPVVNIDFGSGTSAIGPALPAGVTAYTYWPRSFPNDGLYTIASTTDGTENRWWVTSDHTGNPGGYMMVVNASTSLTDYFYKQTVHGLCENTTYEFAAWIMNLIRSTNDVSPPNITFNIERVTGEVLGTYTTGSIPKANTAVWKQFGLFFKTPAGVTDVVIRMTNNSPGGIPGNDLALDDITFRPCGPDIQASIDLTGNPLDLTVCAGNTTDYKLLANVSSGYTNPDYQWQVNFNGLGWTDITGAVSTSVIVHPSAAGSYQYRLSVGQGGALTTCRVVSDMVTITVKDPPVIMASSNSPICVDDILSLTVTEGVSYRWYDPDGNFLSDTRSVGVSTGRGQIGTQVYTVSVTTREGCTIMASVPVTVNDRPAVTISGDTEICTGMATTLHASGGQSYSWSPAVGLSDSTIADPVANPSVTTKYTVTITDNTYPCPSSKTVTVKVLKGAVANAGLDKTIIKGNALQLQGAVSGDNISYYWTPADYLSDASLLNPVSIPEKTITYTLHVISAAGCISAQDEMTLTVNEKIVIPNTFSPNGDNINDVWNIAGLDTYAKPSVAVFNRYGNQVYKSTGYTVPWDGTNNGVPLPVGTYYYLIDLRNGTPSLSGWIWLTR